MMDDPNPKYVVFNLFSGLDRYDGRGPGAYPVDNPVIYDAVEYHGETFKETLHYDERHAKWQLDSHHTQTYMLNALRAHVKKFGTIKEITVDGHGGDQYMSARVMADDGVIKNEDGKTGVGENRFDTRPFLQALAALEKELGRKVADRIVFAGCNVFPELTLEEAQFYREFSQSHQTEIVGATSGTMSMVGLGGAGRYVRFSPDGSITRDQRDTRYNPLILKGEDKNNGWLDYAMDMSAQEGEAKLRTDIEKNIRATIEGKPDWGILSIGDTFFEKTRALDNLSDHIATWYDTNRKQALIVDANGKISAYGGLKLSKDNDPVYRTALSTWIADYQKLNHVDLKEAVEAFNDKAQDHAVAVVMKDQKHVLVADNFGRHLVVDVDHDLKAPPSTRTLTGPPVKSLR